MGLDMGKSKLASQSEPTIPRLVLCAAVLAVEMADLIHDELDLRLDFTSKVVLGYIYNESKCFSVYIYNTVQTKRKNSRTTYGRLANRMSQNMSSLHICGVGRLWTPVDYRQMYKGRTSWEQAVGHTVLLYELQSCTLNGCFKLHQRFKAFFGDKRTCQTIIIWLRHKLHRGIQGTWHEQRPTRPHGTEIPQSTRVHLGIQPPTRLIHGWFLGTPDWGGQKNSGLSASWTAQPLNPWCFAC